MENYTEGDRVFISGFSRGAYTVRVLGALLHQVGLLQKRFQHLIPYAWETCRKSFTPKVFHLAGANVGGGWKEKKQVTRKNR
jgi:uncharacterized protein (DUF2235 family)